MLYSTLLQHDGSPGYHFLLKLHITGVVEAADTDLFRVSVRFPMQNKDGLISKQEFRDGAKKDKWICSGLSLDL
ncbi:Hypp4914 [Branchiostoma lanceolatum]|uniref:Hypp4914 protein n=1 Tax=Branchiostoma lanceolatum TaxID=7740 RepID=A0A8K0F341_BRALA|nr:Hypp4914 [Branchiostoma lanceolatum]